MLCGPFRNIFPPSNPGNNAWVGSAPKMHIAIILFVHLHHLVSQKRSSLQITSWKVSTVPSSWRCVLTMAATSNMFLYSLSLQSPTGITQAITGQFSGTKEQQILTASGSTLSLLRPDATQGRVQTLVSHDVFSIIQSIASFRLAGSAKGTSELPKLSMTAFIG